MCAPVLPALAAVGSWATSAAGMATIGAATAAAGVYTANVSARAQESAIREQLEALEAESVKTESAETNDRLRAMRKEAARTKVAAGEAGLQLGGSVEMLLKDGLMQASLSGERTHLNAERERKSGRSEANSMLSRVERDTALGAGLKIGSAAMGGWNTGKSIKIARNETAKTEGRK
jgi:hypothetical protein